MAKRTRIANIDSLGDLIDRLIVDVLKLGHFETLKRNEQAKTDKNEALIAKWDNASRNCCEFRSQIKNRINELMQEIVESHEYLFLKEERTFTPPAERLSDLLAKRCELAATLASTGDLARAIDRELGLE